MTTLKPTPEHKPDDHPPGHTGNARREAESTHDGGHTTSEHNEAPTPRSRVRGDVLTAIVSALGGAAASWWIWTRTQFPIGAWAVLLIIVLVIWALGVFVGRRKSRRRAEGENA